jgi:carboxypeptidase C (cathepsin A)
MHSGFLNGLPGADTHNVFYWMYKTENWNTSNTPLVVWLNGGPGISSQVGNFISNGLLKISEHAIVTPNATDNTTTTTYNYTVMNNPRGSWADEATMIYVDQPIGTGFSYSKLNQTEVVEDFIVADFQYFMYSLYDMYPEFNERPLYIAGEGYAGKFATLFANTLAPIQDRKFNVTAVLIGNPNISPFAQRQVMSQSPLALNVIE